MATKPRLFFLCVAVCTFLAGCNERGVREVLDEETFVSVVSMTPAFNLYRLLADTSVEREFLSVGPIERIRSAERDRFLWVNAWAVRRDGTHATVALTERITIETDRGDLSLARVAGEHRELDISKPAYRIIRSGEGESYYTLTESDVDALRGATVIAIRSGEREYTLWGDQSDAQLSLQDFIQETTGW